MALQEVYDTQVAANDTVKSALTDTALARAPTHGMLTVYARQEVTSGGKIRLDMKIGTEEVAPNSPMTINNNLSPNRLEDMVGTWPCVEGDQLLAKIRETAGFATDLIVQFIFESKTIAELIAIAGG